MCLPSQLSHMLIIPCAAQAPYSFWRLKGLQDLSEQLRWATASDERLHALRQGCQRHWPAGVANSQPLASSSTERLPIPLCKCTQAQLLMLCTTKTMYRVGLGLMLNLKIMLLLMLMPCSLNCAA